MERHNPMNIEQTNKPTSKIIKSSHDTTTITQPPFWTPKSGVSAISGARLVPKLGTPTDLVIPSYADSAHHMRSPEKPNCQSRRHAALPGFPSILPARRQCWSQLGPASANRTRHEASSKDVSIRTVAMAWQGMHGSSSLCR